MIAASEVSAVLVTRGDIDLTQILDSLPFDDVIVWDNSKRLDRKVFGRYLGIRDARNDTIYVQDDDCVVPVADLLAQYTRGERLCNMSADRWNDYPDSSLVGWGALFPAADAEQAFWQTLTGRWYHADELDRCCDVIFTTLLPFRRIDVGHTDLPWATGPNRMYTGDPDHWAIRQRVLEKARALR